MMGIDLTNDKEAYNELKSHLYHEISVVAYGDPSDPTNIAIECESCGVVLISFDKPEK